MTDKKECSNIIKWVNNQQKPWDNIETTIQELFDLRLVEHLAMPISKDRKETLLSGFRQKMNFLHASLQLVQKQGKKVYDSGSTREKNHSKAALQSRYYGQRTDRIKKIETLYSELFFQGSFKFYQKVALAFDLPLNLEPIDIDVWVKNCNNDDQFDEQECCCSENGCCCQEKGCCCCCKD